MNKKIKIVKISGQYYHGNISIIVGDKDLMKKHIKKKYDMTTEWIDETGAWGNAKALEISISGDVHYIIWMESFSSKTHEIALLVHELFHLTVKVLRDVGFTFSKDSEEAYTYYLQYVTQEALIRLGKR